MWKSCLKPAAIVDKFNGYKYLVKRLPSFPQVFHRFKATSKNSSVALHTVLHIIHRLYYYCLNKNYLSPDYSKKRFKRFKRQGGLFKTRVLTYADNAVTRYR